MKEKKVNQRRYHRGRRKKKNYVGTVIMIIAFIVFIFAGIMLARIFLQYQSGDDEYKKVEKLAIAMPEDPEDQDSYEKYWVDFDALSKENADVVAWLRFDQPDVINYPVVQTNNNDTYLDTSFQKNSSIYGTIFMEQSNDAQFTDDNTILYGHNMKSGAMFGSLKKYNEESYYKENPYFYIYTPDGKASKYQICAARRVNAVGDAYYITFGDEETRQTYLDTMHKESFYDTGAEINEDSKLVTLSTCTNDDSERLIIQGVLVEQKEMVKE